LAFAGGDFTEHSTLALSIQDLDQKLMLLLMEINVVVLFQSRSASMLLSRSYIDHTVYVCTVYIVTHDNYPPGSDIMSQFCDVL